MADHLSVRDVDMDLWRQLRAIAVGRGTNVGTLLNDILRAWLKANKK